jgi:hypothetical protein
LIGETHRVLKQVSVQSLSNSNCLALPCAKQLRSGSLAN